MSDAPAIFSPKIEAALSKPDSKAGRLQRALLRLLQDRPEVVKTTSARFLYYELVQTEVISKKTKERTDGKKGRRSDQDLIDQLTHLRELGIVPWWQIADETRSFTGWRRAPTIRQRLKERWGVESWDGLDDFPEKPPRMHWTTYHRLKKRDEELSSRWCLSAGGWLERQRRQR